MKPETWMMKTLTFALVCFLVPAWLHAKMNEAEANKICARYEHYSPGPEAQATEEDSKLADSLAPGSTFVELARTQKEYDATRRYCLVTGNCSRDLAMIFANGWGVRRDYDAATYFLCLSEGDVATYELWSMLEHVQNMRTAKDPEDLLYCHHAVSGAGQLYCAQLDNERNSTEWDQRIASIKSKLGAPASVQLDELVKSATAFAEAESDLLTYSDRGGTGYAAEAVSDQNTLYAAFVSECEQFSKARADKAGSGAWKLADAALNKAYQQAMATPPKCYSCSDDSKAHAEALNTVREAQRAWIKYRDAWIVFYQARWKGSAEPELLKMEIATALTLHRTDQLSKIHDENEDEE